MNNDLFPTTRGMSDEAVEARQRASRRVTRSPRPYAYGELKLVTTPTKLEPLSLEMRRWLKAVS